MSEPDPFFTVVEYDGTVRELNEEELANIEASQAPLPEPPAPVVPKPPRRAQSQEWM